MSKSPTTLGNADRPDERTVPIDGRESPTRVLLCEKEALVRAGLKAIIQPSGIEVVAEVDSYEQLLRYAHRSDIDAILMNIAPNGDNRVALPAVAKKLKRPAVIIIKPSDHDSLLRFLGTGTRGFVASNAAQADVSTAIHAVINNQAFLSPMLAVRLLDWLDERMNRQIVLTNLPTVKLSDRELEVLRLLGRGSSNAEISKALRIRQTTVRSHVYHILTKLNLRSRAEAVLYGFQFGLRGRNQEVE